VNTRQPQIKIHLPAGGDVAELQIIIVLRIVGGICAGVMWPMIAAYAMRLVQPEHHVRLLLSRWLAIRSASVWGCH